MKEFAPGIPYRDFLFACRDEIEIEVELYNGLEIESYEPEFKAALVMIDRAKANGTYTRQRKEMRAKLPKLPAAKPIKHDETHAENWDNLIANLNSPDPNRKARFEALFSQVSDRGYNDPLVKTVLDTLEKAPNKSGRKRVNRVPWESVTAAMDFMRRELARGKARGRVYNEAAVRYPPSKLEAGKEEYGGKPERRRTLKKLYNTKNRLRK